LKKLAGLIILCFAALAFASVPIVTIEAPSQVNLGQTANVGVTVNHLNPNSMHYIDWVRVYNGDQIVAEKDYTGPQGAAIFSDAFAISLPSTAQLRAEAHCIIHGVASSPMVTVNVVGQPTPIQCRMSLCDCQCYPPGQTPEERDGRMCGINCLGLYNATGCVTVNDTSCAVVHATPTPLGCHMSLCDCQCYPEGQTPEEKDGRMCGINCLGEFNATGCRETNGACNVVYRDQVECATDADCVPAECCHARSCTGRGSAPNCTGIACTMDCQAGTLDCGGGSCSCVNGVCGVRLGSPTPAPIVTATQPPATPAPAPAPSGGNNTMAIVGVVLLVAIVGIGAYLYLGKKAPEQPKQD